MVKMFFPLYLKKLNQFTENQILFFELCCSSFFLFFTLTDSLRIVSSVQSRKMKIVCETLCGRTFHGINNIHSSKMKYTQRRSNNDVRATMNGWNNEHELLK